MTSATATVTASRPFVGPRGLWGALVEATERNHLFAQERALGLRLCRVVTPEVAPPLVDVFRAPDDHEPLVLDLAMLDCFNR
jgi:hypothetical protein